MSAGVTIDTLVTRLVKAQSTNSTDSAFPSRLPTATRPARSATRAVFDLGDAPYRRERNTLVVVPFGGNDNNDTFNIRVLGWNATEAENANKTLYVKEVVCEVAVTLSSTLVGVANKTVVATEFFADTLSLTSGIAILKQGTADVDVASFLCDVSGYEIVEIIFDIGTGADAMNALVRFM